MTYDRPARPIPLNAALKPRYFKAISKPQDRAIPCRFTSMPLPQPTSCAATLLGLACDFINGSQ